MTSLLSSYSQIGSRVMFFKSVGQTTEYTAKTTASINAIMTDAEWTAAIQSTALGTSGTLYRDLGKRATVVNSNGIETAKYILVQIVDGTTSEGVPTNYAPRIYVKTWNADLSGLVTVARTG